MSDKYGAIDPITGMEMGFNPLGTPKEPKPCPKCKKLQAENKDLKERIELAVYYLPESPDKALSFLKPATEKKSSISTMEEYERNAYRGEIGRFEKRVKQLQTDLDKAKEEKQRLRSGLGVLIQNWISVQKISDENYTEESDVILSNAKQALKGGEK